uniref:Protein DETOXIFICATION n=1 Tax=Brassica oleracea var. oleracea TaxID=109376 RepID=A0A0D2ZQU5_BRAOL
MYTRNSQEYEARPDMRNRIGESNNNYSRSWGKDRSERSHAGRIIRRKDEFKRNDRYGGGRARTGPYDRNDGRSWRVKPKLNNATDSEQNGNGVANKRNEIVPYEHFLGAGSHDPLISGNDLSSREENKEDTSGTRKLASAIVTPSRVRSSENVTVRGRVDEVPDARLLTFSPQAKGPVDDQIIGALSDMELVDQQDSGLMDTDANEDDLLGDELMEMEGEALLNAERANGDEKKKAKHKRLDIRRSAPLGSSSRKFEILRRGSPSKRTARSGSLASERVDKAGRYRVRVSNEIGSGNSKGAKFATMIVVLTSLSVGVILFFVFLFLSGRVSYIFTRSELVAAQVADLSPILAFSILLNSVQPVLSGVAVGGGWQKYVTYVNLACYYLVGIPTGIFLGYVVDLQVKGVWLGMIFGIFVQTCVLTIMTMKTDWDKQVSVSQRRLNRWVEPESRGRNQTSPRE